MSYEQEVSNSKLITLEPILLHYCHSGKPRSFSVRLSAHAEVSWRNTHRALLSAYPLAGWRGMVAPPMRYGCLKLLAE